MTGVLTRGAGPSRMGTHTRKSHMRTQQETVICKPRREASGETQPADTLSWTSSLQNYEQVSFCCLSHPAYGVLLYSSLADYYREQKRKLEHPLRQHPSHRPPSQRRFRANHKTSPDTGGGESLPQRGTACRPDLKMIGGKHESKLKPQFLLADLQLVASATGKVG